MPPSRDDLARITRLRDLFLDEERGSSALADYWRNPADLRAYDAVLAARIGWKWDAALAECAERGWARADDAVVLDFGCGSGIAARRFVGRFGARQVLCHDRSAVAMAFAVAQLRDAAPPTAAQALPDLGNVRPDVLLISHVLGELDEEGRARLHALIARSQRVVLVEPGNHLVARQVSALRDSLLDTFRVTAPCPHAGPCPALANAGDWCHFFAPPPPSVFTDSEWGKTARALGFDLRALPYSFLALQRSPAPTGAPATRVLGRPRVMPRVARVQVCTGDGLRDVAIGKRDDPVTWRALKKTPESVRSLPS